MWVRCVTMISSKTECGFWLLVGLWTVWDDTGVRRRILVVVGGRRLPLETHQRRLAAHPAEGSAGVLPAAPGGATWKRVRGRDLRRSPVTWQGLWTAVCCWRCWFMYSVGTVSLAGIKMSVWILNATQYFHSVAYCYERFAFHRCFILLLAWSCSEFGTFSI